MCTQVTLSGFNQADGGFRVYVKFQIMLFVAATDSWSNILAGSLDHTDFSSVFGVKSDLFPTFSYDLVVSVLPKAL